MTDIPEGCTPFDLEKAKAGAKVMYANGEEVVEWHVWKDGSISSRPMQWIVMFHESDGVCIGARGRNLVMAPPPMREVTLYANVATTGDGRYGGMVYDVENDARQDAIGGQYYVLIAHPITLKVPV